MKLYQTPGGTWAGNEKDWAAAMRAEGLEPRKWDGRKIVDVPTSKPELMEFLTFHSVNVIRPNNVVAIPGRLGEDLLRPETPPVPAENPSIVVSTTLDELFQSAPLGQQLTLAALACEEAYKRVR